ncbi:major facilitator superfamily permease [Corynebacterium callunae DSM 20147]|uniref:Major facilitator superfamily permease n=2 Tax=Corynebacterium callunae TaxID=1721 RepID=M1UHM2_9CORY|nr:major facilitator superfamily permease [Corynebacterium callunae DSM 20147]
MENSDFEHFTNTFLRRMMVSMSQVQEKLQVPSTGISRGTSTYKRAVLAILAAGLATFNALYCTQALLPTITHELNISPSQSALTISATTGMLALCIVPASILSEKFGRSKVLITSLTLAVLVGLILPFVPNIATLIALRGLQGALLAGTPAVAMTWLAEEINPKDLGHAMGVYIAGNTVGGLMGRMIPAGLLEITHWQNALLGSSLAALVFGLIMVLLLPAQQNFHPKKITLKRELNAMATHWKNPRLALLFAVAFVAMGSFVSLYNYLGFRMIHQFGLSEVLVGAVFLMYLSGTWSSTQAGKLRDKLGNGPAAIFLTLTMLLALAGLSINNLWTTIISLFAFTAAFFALHSSASGWVGLIATTDRAEASSMYLFCYYLGSSLIGWVSGIIFSYQSWVVFIAWLGLLILGLLAITIALAKLEKQRLAKSVIAAV